MPSFNRTNEARHLQLVNISKSFLQRPVLQDVSLTVPPGERVGLVGENGSGKTTLLRIIAGDLDAFGTIRRPRNTMLVAQEAPVPPGQRVGDVLDAAMAADLATLTDLERMATAMSSPDLDAGQLAMLGTRYDELLAVATTRNSWSVQGRCAEAVASIGLAEVARDRFVATLSGGQRHRLRVAAALVMRPDCLLLDEPTNHLDDAATDFLAAQLSHWPGPVLLASHDRGFLDAAVNRIVDLDRAAGTYDAAADMQGTQGVSYSGNYSQYLLAKAAALQRWEHQFAAEQQLRNELRRTSQLEHRDVFAKETSKSEGRASKKFYADRAANTLARRSASAASRLAALERRMVAKPPRQLSLCGALVTGSSRRLPDDHHIAIAAQDVGVKDRLAPVRCDITATSRMLITGSNGSGKSTLLALLHGSLTPSSGALLRAPGVTVGLLDQHLPWSNTAASAQQAYATALLTCLDGRFPQRGLSAVDALQLIHDSSLPALSAWGVIAGIDLDRPVSQLSIGQQRRIWLAALLAYQPTVLLLDEPTNHLSLSLAQELEALIPSYPGAVVIASHDRWLRSRWNDETCHLRPVDNEST